MARAWSRPPKAWNGRARAARWRIDPATRDVVQTVYIRRVEKIGGQIVNVEFDKVENVKDPFKAAMKN